jgi:RNA-binding protein
VTEPTGAGRPAPQLSGLQRRRLRAPAHPLRPVVHVGESGLSEAVVAAVDAALATHELVKIRLHEPDDKRAAARALADASHAALCGLVGHTVILYRPDPEAPRLEI